MTSTDWVREHRRALVASRVRSGLASGLGQPKLYPGV
jgi:hypothetical protein